MSSTWKLNLTTHDRLHKSLSNNVCTFTKQKIKIALLRRPTIASFAEVK